MPAEKGNTNVALWGDNTEPEVISVLMSFFRWSSSPTTRSPAACLRTMWRSFLWISSKLPPVYVYFRMIFNFHQMPALLHAEGPNLCDTGGNSMVHEWVYHLQVIFSVRYQGHFRHIYQYWPIFPTAQSSWRKWQRNTNSIGITLKVNFVHLAESKETKS